MEAGLFVGCVPALGAGWANASANAGRWGRPGREEEPAARQECVCLACLLPSCREEENEIFQCSISVANSITVGTCSKRCNFQEAEIEKLAANEMANDWEVQTGAVSRIKHLEKNSHSPHCFPEAALATAPL